MALGLLLTAAGLAPPTAAAEGPDCEWVAGDLHIHSTYSHDSYGGPQDDNTGPEGFYTLGHSVQSQFLIAASRGLDFLAITDHNDVRSQWDPGFGSLGLIGIGGYEKSLDGHAQMLGSKRIYDAGQKTAAEVTAIADALRADGGAFQINHPAEGSVDHPQDSNWRYGYDVVPDTVEVWSISRLWQPPAPSASSNDDAIRYWEGWLDRGVRVGATGGSDNHYLATTTIQGAGQPTTWVCASSVSEAGVIDGLRSGHTFISHQPPSYSGPEIYLEGDAEGDGTFESMVGDAVPPGSELRVRVVGAPGSLLRLISNGGQQLGEAAVVGSHDFTQRFSLPADQSWVRAEILHPDAGPERSAICDGTFGSQTTYCRNSLLVLGMTSALFVAEPVDDVEPVSSLTYTGATSGRAGSDAVLKAVLLDGEGTPLTGRAITFSFRGSSYSATTDDTGTASVSVRLQGPPGAYEVHSVFAGDDSYPGSEDRDTFTITGGRP